MVRQPRRGEVQWSTSLRRLWRTRLDEPEIVEPLPLEFFGVKDPDFSEAVLLDYIKSKFALLSVRHAAVLNYIYVYDLTLPEVGRIFNVSPERIRQNEARALRIIRAMVWKEKERVEKELPLMTEEDVVAEKDRLRKEREAFESARLVRQAEWDKTQAGLLKAHKLRQKELAHSKSVQKQMDAGWKVFHAGPDRMLVPVRHFYDV